MVLALLLAAILWNLGTWLLGLPASSSHTLIGSILGVGLASSLVSGTGFGDGVNWHKAGEVGLSLLLSPLIGFSAAALVLIVARRVIASPRLHEPPREGERPPGWIRGILLLTCSGVSFAHGSNDGQKGVGLIVLILIGIVPAHFALDVGLGAERVSAVVASIDQLESTLTARPELAGGRVPVARELAEVRSLLAAHGSIAEIPADERWRIRTDILEIDDALGRFTRDAEARFSEAERAAVADTRARLREATDYAPGWVVLAVALALGIGTTIGWKRIVVTVGEKIGKGRLTYAQGASAEVVAMSTIAMADVLGLPVSTTHVLSSGVAGTMMANRSGVQLPTVRSIALAWLLTLPVSMVLAGGLFLVFRLLVP